MPVVFDNLIHAGDMPVLVADGSGTATLTAELDVITVGSGAGNVIGKTQPTGNSGARVACGVIRRS